MRAGLGAIGAYLLVFGFFLVLLAYSVLNAIYGYGGYNTNQALAVQLAGMFLASFGAGLLVYGIGSRSPVSQVQP